MRNPRAGSREKEKMVETGITLQCVRSAISQLMAKAVTILLNTITANVMTRVWKESCDEMMSPSRIVSTGIELVAVS